MVVPVIGFYLLGGSLEQGLWIELDIFDDVHWTALPGLSKTGKLVHTAPVHTVHRNFRTSISLIFF